MPRRMTVFVELPWDNISRDFTRESIGKEVLDWVYKEANIKEREYFGLQYHENGDTFWLNARNPIKAQWSGNKTLHLKVKYPVEPQDLQLEETRHLFYQIFAQDVINNPREYACTTQEACDVVAFLSQSTYGDYTSTNAQFVKEKLEKAVPLHHSTFCCVNKTHTDAFVANFIQTTLKLYKGLKGVKLGNAEYGFLRKICGLKGFQTESYSVKSVEGTHLAVQADTSGILITGQNREDERIEYPALTEVLQDGEKLKLDFSSDDFQIKSLQLKSKSKKCSEALYRCIVERKLFYSCDMVPQQISSQMSVLNFWSFQIFESKFIFDITKTKKEAMDDNRRRVFHSNGIGQTDSSSDASFSEKQNSSEPESETGCCVCKDSCADVTFKSCSHCVCCQDCTFQLDKLNLLSCPVCRTTFSLESCEWMSSVS